jgi:CheY-like chemotaxis protein
MQSVSEREPKMIAQGRMTEKKHIRLMVVEDDPGVGYAVSRWLQDQNVRSVLATTTHEAVEMLRDVIFIESTFDGLLVDYNLPDDTGFRVIEEFRDEFPYMPVALMSGSDSNELQAWADRRRIPLFPKPLKLDHLQAWLEALKQTA